MNASQKTRSCPALGLDLAPNKQILYKFFVSSESQIPEGLREISREPSHKLDLRHAQQAMAQGADRLAEDGRVRSGHVDTGIAVYQNEERVRIGSLRSLLAREGFWLTDAHWFEKKGFKGRPSQFVIVLLLSQMDGAMKLPRKTMEALRKLARENVWRTNVWDNSNLGNPSTVNFTARQQGNPNRTLVVDGEFMLLTTLDGENAIAVEQREDAKIGSALLAELEEVQL